MGEPPPRDGVDDSPAQFCADFASLLDSRKVSLRAAEALSGWGKSTIGAARRGPDLPNVDLVVDVVSALGQPESVQQEWRSRYRRLTETPDLPPDDDQPAKDEPAVDQLIQDAKGPLPVRGRIWRWLRGGGGHRRLLVGAAAVLLIAAGLSVWALVLRTSPAERTLVIQNEVAVGPSDLHEDRTLYFLSARPIARCASVPGCKMAGTDLRTGDTVIAVCQLQGALLTNADVGSVGIKDNPNVAGSALWYGVRWPDGRRGYVSEVYVAPTYRGGLQLPPC